MARSEASTRPPGVRGRLVRTAAPGGLLLSETWYAGGELLAVHRHDRAYVSVLVAGSYTEVDASETRLCSGPTMIYHPPGEVHADHFGRDGRCVNVELSEGAMRRLTASGFDAGRRAVIARDGAPASLDVFARWADGSETAESAARAVFAELAAFAARARSATVRPAWLDAAVAAMDDDLAERRSVAAVAAAVGVHPTHLAREFRRVLQCSPSEYRRRRRFESAARRLRESDAGVARIAHAAGFADHSHLVRTFQEWSGMSPAVYRARFGRDGAVRML